MRPYSNDQLYAALLELEVIDKQELAAALAESVQSDTPLDDILLKRDLVSEESLGKIIGDVVSAPYVNLSEVAIPSETLHLIPEHVAKKQQAIVFKVDSKGVHVASTNPVNTEFFELLAIKANSVVLPYFTTSRSLKKAFSEYTVDIAEAFTTIIAENIEKAAHSTAEPPIIAIVDTILRYAHHSTASDVHIEPQEEKVLVRFRIDGILHDSITLPLELGPQVVTRIKVMADMRTDEHKESQDGKLRFETDDEKIDIRVSIAPITRGEKIVLRLLSESSRNYSLRDLGIDAKLIDLIEEAYKLPHGMILATGPTGSGKTTTLYALLKLINSREINIMTIEDPVEYQLENINQIQVSEATGTTFAKGLRAIVRQDPDVLLVGEIRDDETADIAVNSAMTGHLVLSTLHTNDAVTTFPRLQDMGIEPYLLTTTITLIIAQRLVRKICPRCRVSAEVAVSALDEHMQPYFASAKEKTVLYSGKGCPVCHQTGYQGRIGVYEVLVLNDELREAIIAKQTSQELMEIACAHGMKTMLEDGIAKVKQGITSLEELQRVIKETV